MGCGLGKLCRTPDLYKDKKNVWYESREKIEEDYEFGKELGSGVFAQVIEIKNRNTNLRSAAKHFSKRVQMIANEVTWAPAAQLLVEEVSILKLLNGRNNCLKLNGILETPGELWILLEFCNRGDLMGFIENRPTEPNVNTLSMWSGQLLKAIAYCHSLAVAHRDIKPENILVRNTPSNGIHREDIVLGDFGSAARWNTQTIVTTIKTISSNEESKMSPPESNLLGPEEKQSIKFTEERGSSFWSSPETWMNSYDYRADNWSAGLVILVLVDGMLSSEEIRVLHRTNLQAMFQHTTKYGLRGARGPLCLEPDFVHLLQGLLTIDVDKRLTAKAALSNPWILRGIVPTKLSSSYNTKSSQQPANIDLQIRSNAARYNAAARLDRAVHLAIRALLTPEDRAFLRQSLDGGIMQKEIQQNSITTLVSVHDLASVVENKLNSSNQESPSISDWTKFKELLVTNPNLNQAILHLALDDEESIKLSGLSQPYSKRTHSTGFLQALDEDSNHDEVIPPRFQKKNTLKWQTANQRRSSQPPRNSVPYKHASTLLDVTWPSREQRMSRSASARPSPAC